MGVEVSDAELDILLLFAEAERRGNLIVKVNLLLVEDEHVAARDYIPCRVDQVATTIYLSTVLVIEFAICSLENDLVALLINFELTEDFADVEAGQLCHASLSQLLALALRALRQRSWVLARRATLAVVFGVRVRATAASIQRVIRVVRIIVLRVHPCDDVVD